MGESRMTVPKSRIALFVLAIALAGCGGPDGSDNAENGESVTVPPDSDAPVTEVTITNSDGEKVVQQSGAGVAVDLPDGFTLYPGAKVITNTTTDAGADGRQSTVMVESDARPEEIAAFYKSQAEKAGMEIAIDLTFATTSTIAADRLEDATKLTVTASREEGAEATTAMINIVEGRGD